MTEAAFRIGEAIDPADAGEARGSTLRGRVLVVDDERNIRRVLRLVLESEGAEVVEASTASEALECLQGQAPIDVVLMDVKMPGMSGIEALEVIASNPSLRMPVIMISGHASVTDAVRATRLGAFDFFEKPLERERVVVSVRNAIRQSRATAEIEALRRQSRGELIGTSDAVMRLIGQIEKVAPSRARVLIQGESGSGKELVARAIHDASPRRHRPFVKVNCAAIPRELIESELFGHERGAFTGATAQKKGLFEVAHEGTLLLDEVGDMDLDAQAKVLRVLQTGEFMRVGGQHTLHADVRVMAATHRKLQDSVSAGEFREDLYFRLAVVPLDVPPLRARPNDIPELSRAFIAEACRDNGLSSRQLSPDALALMQGYPWPGNVRELKNIMERMVVLSDGDLGVDDLPEEIRRVDQQWRRGRGRGEGLSEELAEVMEDHELSLRSVREAVERALILKRLREHGWNVSRAAESLELERTHLHRKMRVLKIQRGQS